ncbi:cytochrome c1 [Methylopila henanensis]|uniref:Cytochrome c1 n=1 Tax=Methylopila henanensis TaxID=873516 RepID=A0ABW4K2T6_9HYPH
MPMTISRLARSLAAAAALAVTLGGAGAAQAAEAGPKPPMQSWSFWGPLGKFEPGQLQRGFKVYREVCSSCHSLSLVSFRNLMQPGGPQFSEGQVRTIAEEYKVQDGPNDSGDMFERPGRLSDAFPKAFPNEQAARAANGGAYPPDFSLLAKARTYERGFPWFLWDIVAQYQEQGPDYIHALLVGYEAPPEGVKPSSPGLHYNKYFPGHWIAMAQPIQDGQVEYTDGTPTTVDQYGKDLAAFLMWTAEPHLAARKGTGLVVMIFLIMFLGLLVYVKKKVWSGAKPVHA